MIKISIEPTLKDTHCKQCLILIKKGERCLRAYGYRDSAGSICQICIDEGFNKPKTEQEEVLNSGRF